MPVRPSAGISSVGVNAECHLDQCCLQSVEVASAYRNLILNLDCSLSLLFFWHIHSFGFSQLCFASCKLLLYLGNLFFYQFDCTNRLFDFIYTFFA